MHLHDAGLMLGQRRGRWANIKATLDDQLICYIYHSQKTLFIDAMLD